MPDCGAVRLLGAPNGDGPSRNWIIQRPSAAVYANGTRAFAYPALCTKRTGAELTLALDDLNVADGLPSATIGGPTRAQVERVRELNVRVREVFGAKRGSAAELGHILRDKALREVMWEPPAA